MSVAINIENVIKRFGKDTIISGLSLDVRPGGFFTFLGSPGCDKTTLLCMIVGFNSIEDGEIKIDGKVINNIPTNKRDMGVVFQNYATFPHMSIRDNMASGLRNHKVPQDQIESQADEILEMVRVDHLKKRMPPKLSDGQWQRVALAKVIIVHSGVLLMDEPLSNLNAKLRVKMRDAIKRIQQQVGITTIYMIHDQRETLVMLDCIAVMNGGAIQQIDTPEDVYQRPSNIFMSTFVGLSNIMDGRIEARDGQTFLHIEDYSIPMENLSHGAGDGQAMKVSIQPEESIINREGSDGISAVVRGSISFGITTRYFVETADGREIEVI